MTPIQALIAAITGTTKPKALTVSCPECDHSFEVNQDDKEELKTSPETGSTSGDDAEEDDDTDEDDDDEFEDSMTTPKSRADKVSAIAKSLLEVTKDRESVGAKAHEVSPKQSVEIVKNTKKIVENPPADLLTAALNKAAKEARR
jgi:uncharacterized Zn finger protein (UPF0148 family)